MVLLYSAPEGIIRKAKICMFCNIYVVILQLQVDVRISVIWIQHQEQMTLINLATFHEAILQWNGFHDIFCDLPVVIHPM